MDQEVQNQTEQMTVDAKELMYRRGDRDGRAGLNPSSTSPDYMKGYVEGRRSRIERNLRTG
jgi:hypothetical protein